MVSVCMATFNGEKYVKEQLESILSQIHEEDEVVISDDGSKDRTVEIIKSLNDSRIKLFFNEGKHGFSENFINALQKSSGDIIFLADQDDVWLPDKYRIVCDLLKEYDLVVTNSIVTDEKLNPIQDSFFDCYKSGKGIIKNIVCNTYYGSCMAFRRKILDVALPVPQSKEVGYDVWIGLVSEVTGKVLFYPEPQILYRRHDNTTTSTESFMKRSNRSLFLKLYGRVVMLKEIISFYLKYHFGNRRFQVMEIEK